MFVNGNVTLNVIAIVKEEAEVGVVDVHVHGQEHPLFEIVKSPRLPRSRFGPSEFWSGRSAAQSAMRTNGHVHALRVPTKKLKMKTRINNTTPASGA